MRMKAQPRSQFELRMFNSFNRQNAHYCTALFLAFLLALPPQLLAQAPPTAPQGTPVAPLPTIQNLKVRVLAGQGEANDLGRRVMAPLAVQVVDQNDQPVEGADVVFRFPPA